VFQPRTDLENLDEADRDVELSVLWDTTPRKNRPKVQLNLESIFNKNGNKDGRVPVQAT
jgi:hypothetical protein